MWHKMKTLYRLLGCKGIHEQILGLSGVQVKDDREFLDQLFGCRFEITVIRSCNFLSFQLPRLDTLIERFDQTQPFTAASGVERF